MMMGADNVFALSAFLVIIAAGNFYANTLYINHINNTLSHFPNHELLNLSHFPNHEVRNPSHFPNRQILSNTLWNSGASTCTIPFLLGRWNLSRVTTNLGKFLS